ncbi:MAG: hypothetical protein IJC28_02275, partial [Mailhella sp.]|nr:hypothetical protein [Mailhella sp.]
MSPIDNDARQPKRRAHSKAGFDMDNRGEDRKDFAEKRSFRKNDGERGERRFERSDNFKPRRFERDGERRDFKKDGFRPHGDKRPRG